MKGNEKIVTSLNALLGDELAAGNQYILHAEICENWLYGKLHDSIKKRAIGDYNAAIKLARESGEGGARAVEQLRVVMGELQLQIADVRSQAFTAMTMRSILRESTRARSRNSPKTRKETVPYQRPSRILLWRSARS